MAKARANWLLRLITAIAALVGPCAAYRYQHGPLLFFMSSPDYDLWLLVLIAALCMAIGVVAFFKRARIIGVVCILSNSVVFALYGFIAGFFALGGTR